MVFYAKLNEYITIINKRSLILHCVDQDVNVREREKIIIELDGGKTAMCV